MDDLRLFCDVARHQSFSLAAGDHGISQPAASQRVGHLEKRLGVRLIDRTVRPLVLTEAGRVYLRGCQELLDRHGRLEQQVARFRPDAEGEVRVEAIYSAGIGLLYQLKESFEARHDGVKITVEYKHPEHVYEAVRHDRCDLGIVSYPKSWRDVEVIPLRDESMVLTFAPGHPLAGSRRVEASELARWPMVAFEQSLPVARGIKRYFRENHVNPVVTNVFDNIDTIKSAVAVTEDVAILPRVTTQRELAAGTLAVAEIEPVLMRPLGIIHRKRSGHRGHGNAAGNAAAGAGPSNGNGSDRKFRPVVQAFVEWLLEHAGPQTTPDAGQWSPSGGQLARSTP